MYIIIHCFLRYYDRKILNISTNSHLSHNKTRNPTTQQLSEQNMSGLTICFLKHLFNRNISPSTVHCSFRHAHAHTLIHTPYHLPRPFSLFSQLFGPLSMSLCKVHVSLHSSAASIFHGGKLHGAVVR